MSFRTVLLRAGQFDLDLAPNLDLGCSFEFEFGFEFEIAIEIEIEIGENSG